MFTWRDGVATILVTVAAIVFASFVGAWSLPGVADARTATLVIGVIGLATCIVGGSAMTSFRGPYVGLVSVLGSVATAILLAGLVTGWSLAPGLLIVDIVLMWTIATAHHALAGARSPQHA